MAELREGTIKTRKVKRGIQAYLEVATKKDPHKKPVRGFLSADLAKLSEAELEGIDVEYEVTTANAPIRIRRKGEKFVEAPSSSRAGKGKKTTSGSHDKRGPRNQREASRATTTNNPN